MTCRLSIIEAALTLDDLLMSCLTYILFLRERDITLGVLFLIASQLEQLVLPDEGHLDLAHKGRSR